MAECQSKECHDNIHHRISDLKNAIESNGKCLKDKIKWKTFTWVIGGLCVFVLILVGALGSYAKDNDKRSSDNEKALAILIEALPAKMELAIIKAQKEIDKERRERERRNQPYTPPPREPGP